MDRVFMLKQDDKVGVKYQCLNSSNPAFEAELLQDYFQLDIKLTDLYKHWSQCDPNFARISSVSILMHVDVVAFKVHMSSTYLAKECCV